MRNKLKYLKSFLLITCLITISCNQKKDDPKNIVGQKNNELFSDPDKKNEAEFLVNITELELLQINLAKLANQNSIDPKIKEIAVSFSNNHIKQLYEIRNIAAKKGIAIPDELTKKEEENYKKISFEIAEDFDKIFFDENVRNLKKMIPQFEKANNFKDQDIRLWSINTVPVLRKNLGIALVYQASTHKTKPLK